MAHDVFISYSSTDQNAALAVLHGLEATGIRCWMAPRDIKPGAIWAQSIMEGIGGSRVMVVVFSANANRSAHVINEVDAAVRKGAIIVPFRIEDVMPDGAMEYHLRTRHWLDALTPDLESHTSRLAEQVGMLLDANQTAAIPTPPPRPMPDDLPPRRKASQPRAPRPPINWRRVRMVAVFVIVLLAVVAYYFTRERPVHDVTFTIRQASGSGANQASLRVSSGALRFFEGGDPMPPLGDRQYVASFVAGSTRYIYPEVKLKSEAPGRVVNVPMSCAILGNGGVVSGAVIINGRIQPDWTETYHAHGYGSAQPGTWKPGHYRADCKYGDKLINRGWFDVTEAATAGASKVAASSGPVAEASPLREITARVSSVRFYESGFGPQALKERQYGTSFAAGETRYVNVEVTIDHQAPGRMVNARLFCRYLRDRTTSVARVQIDYSIQPTWTKTISVAGWGSQSPAFWKPGSYLVACDDGRRTLGQAGFEIR